MAEQPITDQCLHCAVTKTVEAWLWEHHAGNLNVAEVIERLSEVLAEVIFKPRRAPAPAGRDEARQECLGGGVPRESDGTSPGDHDARRRDGALNVRAPWHSIGIAFTLGLAIGLVALTAAGVIG